MKTSFKKNRNSRGVGPASRASVKRKGDLESGRTTGEQGRLIRDIENSAAMTIQRQQLERSFNQPLQRQEEEELQMQQTPLQRQQEEEEASPQKNVSSSYSQGGEEKEELQMQQAPIQRQPEEEEIMQGKFESLQRQAPEEEELMQGKAESTLQREQQSAAPTNRTGMPDNLKAGIESLSGQDLSAVRVHYNSAKPSEFNALAYAQGNDIHLGSGQEKHLPHEAWHTVQQREGRVEPTMEMSGEKINDDASLEHEADEMGARAMQYRKK